MGAGSGLVAEMVVEAWVQRHDLTVFLDNSTNKRREGVKLHEVVVNRRGLIEA